MPPEERSVPLSLLIADACETDYRRAIQAAIASVDAAQTLTAVALALAALIGDDGLTAIVEERCDLLQRLDMPR